jgi:hypothetical protein
MIIVFQFFGCSFAMQIIAQSFYTWEACLVFSLIVQDLDIVASARLGRKNLSIPQAQRMLALLF